MQYRYNQSLGTNLLVCEKGSTVSRRCAEMECIISHSVLVFPIVISFASLNTTQSKGADTPIDSRLQVTKSNGPDNFTWQKATPFSKRLHCALAKLVDVSHLSASKNQRESDDSDPKFYSTQVQTASPTIKETFTVHTPPALKLDTYWGIDSHLVIKGSGTVAWTFEANNHMLRTLRLPCYFVPGSNSWIASLQQILLAYPRESVNVTANALELSGDTLVPGITVQYSTASLLPTKPTLPKHEKCSGMTLVAPEHSDNLYCHRVQVMMNVGPSVYSLNEPALKTAGNKPTHEAPPLDEPNPKRLRLGPIFIGPLSAPVPHCMQTSPHLIGPLLPEVPLDIL